MDALVLEEISAYALEGVAGGTGGDGGVLGWEGAMRLQW